MKNEFRKVKIAHLVYIPMTGVGLYGGYRGDDWYAERAKIFKNYTIKSLQNQTNKNFILLISFRPQEANHPITKELAEYMQECGLEYILTFQGLMYHDDKYSKGFFNRFMNMGRVARGCYRTGNWKDLIPSMLEVYENKNATLPQRLEIALGQFEKYFRGADYVYVTRVDSDDMFRKEAFSEILEQSPAEFEAFVRNKGFLYNKDTGRLAEWLPPTNPPFHTIVFKRNVFFDPKLHLLHMAGFRSHEDITRIFKTKQLSDYQYCILVDNSNQHISTIWEHPFRGKDLTDGTHEIMNEFGIKI